MEVLVSVENFEDSSGKYREINSPRSLEACLRSGLDPSELYPRPKNHFKEPGLEPQMLDIKYNTFQTKRQDKIDLVRKERQAIITFTEKKARTLSSSARSPSPDTPPVDTAAALRAAEEHRAAAQIELEEKRLEALKRRQEKELAKIVEREQTMAALQQKIANAEAEEVKRKKAHAKKVAEEKLQEEKRKAARAQELKQQALEEAERKRALARKEREIEEKLKKKRQEEERELIREARRRDEERKEKVEEARRKTEALLKAQEEIAEKNRLDMIEREQRILQQLEQKKEDKKEEVARQREKAAARICAAMEKHHELHEKKKEEFDERQRAALARARENAAIEQEKLKKQAEEREKRNKTRLHRLMDAYRHRREVRNEIIARREERDSVFVTVQEERDKKLAMTKFLSDLKLQDKMENVERVSRQTEFRRLQVLQKIYSEDNKYEEILEKKNELQRRHDEETKLSLIRKHEIADTMERMRTTNDFSLLDKLFVTKGKSKTRGRLGTTSGPKGEEEDDPRLNATV